MLRWHDLRDGPGAGLNASKRNIIASYDTEFDGPAPSRHNLREIGVYFMDADTREFVHKFRVALKPRDDAEPEECCMTEFWSKHPEKMAKLDEEGLEPGEAMAAFEQAIAVFKKHAKSLLLVAAPACCDWMFVNDYLHRYKFDAEGNVRKGFCKDDVLSYWSHCLSSELRGAATALGIKKSQLREFVESDARQHMKAHYALEDAKAQAIAYINLQTVLRNFTYYRLYFACAWAWSFIDRTPSQAHTE